MKRKIVLAVLAASMLFNSGWVMPAQASQTDTSSQLYWSTQSAPVIYGPSKITIPRGTQYDPMDTRFRVFAKDFEDRDVSQDLSWEGDTVNTDQAGTYTLTYRVTDSHGNQASRDVQIVVTEETEGDILVERIMYTTPSVWNMDLAGFTRNNYGDSQHLGVFMPEGSSLEMRVLSGGTNLNVNCYGNDSHQETSVKIPADGSWTTVSNVKSGTPYASVPLVTTPVMEKGAALNQTYTIEVKYGSDVEELNYYLKGDSEEAFREKWNADQDKFGVIENQVLTAVVPYADLGKTTKHFAKGFQSLEEFNTYWEESVRRMDEMVGLDDQGTDPLHQNVPTRYVVKANRHGAGSAYYSGSHVGINNESIAAFFEMNWGGLHEFAHGYQGSLGRGAMELGEVSNNIIGYYIQQDKDIYFHEANWLGAFPVKEDGFNKKRLEGATWQATGVDVRLYMICNLLDHFGGGDAYGEMFRWYREALAQGRNMTNTDVYAESLAELYGKNVIPYLEAWGLSVGEDTRNKVYEMGLPVVSILKDMVGADSLAQIMEANQFTEKYEIVTGEVYAGVMGTGSIRINIDDMTELLGKKIRVMDGSTVVKEVVVNGAEVSLGELPAGIYTLKMPSNKEYHNDSEYLKICEGENSHTVNYSRFTEYSFANSMTLKVRGIYDTYGYELAFNDDFTSASVKFGGANIGSAAPWVKIYDQNGTLLHEEGVTQSGSAYYFDQTKGSYEVALEPGSYIEVNHPTAGRVKAFSSLTGDEMAAMAGSSGLTRYTITEGGIRKDSMTEEEGQEVFYQVLKGEMEETIQAYRNAAGEDELADPNTNKKAKEKVLLAYSQLRPEDQAAYADFVQSITVEEAEGADFSGNIMTLKVQGVYGTFGYTMNFHEDYKGADISFGGALIGDSSAYVKIFDGNGTELYTEAVAPSGDKHYFDYENPGYTVELEPGYMIEVKHQNPAKVHMISSLNNARSEAFSASETVTRYVVMEDGVRKAEMSNAEAKEAAALIAQSVAE